MNPTWVLRNIGHRVACQPAVDGGAPARLSRSTRTSGSRKKVFINSSDKSRFAADCRRRVPAAAFGARRAIISEHFHKALTTFNVVVGDAYALSEAERARDEATAGAS
eukprot:4788302-Pyramimonas_sp.AAC.1